MYVWDGALARLSKQEKRQRATARAAGVRLHFTGAAPIWLGTTPADLLAQLDAYVAALDAADQAAVAHADAVAHARALEPGITEQYARLESHVRNVFGANASALGDFGMDVPKKRGPKTTTVKAEMVKKAAATRLARGTKGKRQKKAIKG